MDGCAGCFASFDIGELSKSTSCFDVASMHCVASNRWCNMLSMIRYVSIGARGRMH